MTPDYDKLADSNSPFAQRAVVLLRKGFSIIPVVPGDKNTHVGAAKRTRDPKTVAIWADNGEFNANVGLCADENYTLLESDDFKGLCSKIRAISKKEIPETLKCGSGRENRCCLIFKRTRACGQGCPSIGGLFEFRNWNQYVVGPGSVHPMGLTYRWLNDAPIVEMPNWLVEALTRMHSQATREYEKAAATPGEKIPEGGRHAYFKIHGGRLCNAGIGLEAMEKEFLRVNREKFEIPKSEPEVLKQARDMWKRWHEEPQFFYRAPAENPKPNGHAATAAEPVVVPVEDLGTRADMPEGVLDGKLGEIVQKRMQGCCLAYAWPSLLVIAGASPFLKFEGNKLRANLYVGLVGDVDTGKSAVFDRALYVLGIGDSDPTVLSAKYGSGEALMQELDKVKPCTRLLYPDELKHLLIKAGIENASFPTLLTTAYYHDKQRGGTKRKGKDAKEQFEIDCRLSIAGGLVEADFGECFGSASVSGLYDRFVFGLCPTPYHYQWRPHVGCPETLQVFPPGVDDNVWDEREQWVKDGISPRVAEHALRCAYICAAIDRRDELQASQLGPALALARYQMKFRSVMHPNPGENPVAQCAISVRTWLEQHNPGEWVLRRSLCKGIHSERLGPMVFNQTLTALGMNDEIEVTPSGRSSDSCPQKTANDETKTQTLLRPREGDCLSPRSCRTPQHACQRGGEAFEARRAHGTNHLLSRLLQLASKSQSRWGRLGAKFTN